MELTIEDNNVGQINTTDCNGDSLTQGAGSSNGETYPFYLSRYLPDRIINNNGIGGQVAEQIAARQGSNPIKLTITGNALNGYNEVAVTSMSVRLGSTAADTLNRAYSGTVNGIPVVLQRNGATDAYTLKSAGSVSVAALPADSIFIPDVGYNSKANIQINWWGRNNNPNYDALPGLLASAFDYMLTPKRGLVIGVLNGKLETKGTASYIAITNVNAILKSTYVDRYISSEPPTIEEMNTTGYVYSAPDLIDINNGIFPQALFADTIHLLSPAYKIIALRVARGIQKFGW